MSIFSADDYRKEAEKNIAEEKAKNKRKNKPHWEVQHRISTSLKSKKMWCINCHRQKEIADIVCKQCGIKSFTKVKPK